LLREGGEGWRENERGEIFKLDRSGKGEKGKNELKVKGQRGRERERETYQSW